MKLTRRKICDSRGFTVVELLTAMVILTVVLGSLVGIFISTSNAQIEANRRFQAQQEARQGLERMRREMHCASAVTPLTPPGTWPTSLVQLSLPAGCPGTPATTWCTRSVGSTRWGLFRIAGTAATCTGGTQYADYLTASNAFDFTAGAAGRLSTLAVNLPVDLTPSDTKSAWRLTDNLVLRNDTR